MGILLNISGISIDFDTRFPEYAKKRYSAYLQENAPLDKDAPAVSLRARDEDIARSDVEGVGEEEAELYAMTIPLSEHLPALDRMMTHGVAVGCNGKSYIFTAASGVGKSTHAFLWQKCLGKEKVHIINGDKPILWFREDGEILACGSPWSGKEHLDENVCLPLGGVCLLHRLEGSGLESPQITKASCDETLDFMLHQIFLPADPMKQVKTLQLLETLYESVPVYHLTTDMSTDGAMLSYKVLSGEVVE